MGYNFDDCVEYVRALAKKSVCKRRGVACMIINKVSGETLSWSTNGPAGDVPELCSGIKDGCGCIHSEVNTILKARNTGPCLRDRRAVMIATRAPCVPCASAIVNCGYIGEFIYLDPSEPGADGLAMLRRFGIQVRHHNDGKSDQQLKASAV